MQLIRVIIGLAFVIGGIAIGVVGVGAVLSSPGDILAAIPTLLFGIVLGFTGIMVLTRTSWREVMDFLMSNWH